MDEVTGPVIAMTLVLVRRVRAVCFHQRDHAGSSSASSR